MNLCIYTCFVYLQPFCVTLDFKLFIDSIHILFLLYLLLLFSDSNIKTLQDFIRIYSAFRTDSERKHKKSTLKSTLNMSTQLSSRTWPIRSVQVLLGSVAHAKSEPPLRAASGSLEDPEHRRSNLNPPRTTPLTMETLPAHAEDSLQRHRRRVEASIAWSSCPASSSTVLGGSPEEQEDLRGRMDEFMLHEEYHKSTVGEDGEIPLDALGSPPQTEIGSFLYSGPSTDMADTVSLPRRPRVHEHPRAWQPDLPITSMLPEKSLDPFRPEPTYGALNRTAELLAKLLSGWEDPDVTALLEAVKAKLGITEPLPKPALLAPSPGLSTLADDLKRSSVSRLLPKVTCPSPSHPRARTVPIAELQDVPVTESEKRGLSALAPRAGVSSPPSGLTPGGGKMGRPIAKANIQPELPEFDPKNLPEWAEEFAEFLLLTGQSHVDVATKCSLLKRSCKKKFLQIQVKQIVKTCSTWAEVLQRLEKTFPVYETDLSVRTQIEELPMLPEFPSAARVSEYVCDLEYLFSRMNVCSYGATEPQLWLISKIPQRTWNDCRATSERKSRTNSYNELVDLLIVLALQRENDSHMENSPRSTWAEVVPLPPNVANGKGLKIKLTPTREVVKKGVTYVP